MSKLRISMASAAAATALFATGSVDAQSMPASELKITMGAFSVPVCNAGRPNERGLKDLMEKVRGQYIADFQKNPTVGTLKALAGKFGQYTRFYPNVPAEYKRKKDEAMAEAAKEIASKRLSPLQAEALRLSVDVAVMAGFLAQMEVMETTIRQAGTNRLADLCAGRAPAR